MSQSDRNAAGAQESPGAKPSRIRWGVGEISETINRTPRQTYWLLEGGHLPAKKVGGKWAGEEDALRRVASVPA
jgi:hypothetical protein